MPQQCSLCQKKVLFGHTVSHANNKRRKISHPNLQRVRILLNGAVRRALVCTRCIRSGLAVKA